jgi:hypothetical protein
MDYFLRKKYPREHWPTSIDSVLVIVTGKISRGPAGREWEDKPTLEETAMLVPPP